MRKLSVLLMVLAASLCASAAIAEDRTVHAEWTDWTSVEGLYVADAWSASDVSALTVSDAPNAYAYEGVNYVNHYECHDTVLLLSGLGYLNMDFFMPNYAGGTLKEITVQITYQAIGYEPILGVDAYLDDVLMVSGIYGPYSLSLEELCNNWITATYQFIITPNCDYEYLTLGFEYTGCHAVAVDSVVIDTVCVPEPMTLGLLTLGAVILFGKRK